MKVSPECYECLAKLACDAAILASGEKTVQERARSAALGILEREFTPDVVSVDLATKIHDVIKEISQNQDPYRRLKDDEIEIAGRLFAQVNPLYQNGFIDKLKLAVFGNSIDFFRPVELIDASLKADFAVDESEKLLKKLKSAGSVLYLADNAGEAYFDIPLYKYMGLYTDITYVVKSHPVQNDITEYDLAFAGLMDTGIKLLKTGTASPGIIMSQASTEFLRAFEEADLVFAKGMGYYESLHELPHKGKVFHCLKAKCKPVAQSIGVPLDSFVAMFL